MGGKYFEQFEVGQTFVHEIRRTMTDMDKSRPTQGVVTFEHKGFNQRDEVVCSCRPIALMLRKPA